METRPGAGQPVAPERIGGGSEILSAPEIDAEGILIRGIKVEVSKPNSHQNRWAETKIYISETNNIDINNPGTYDYIESGKQSEFHINYLKSGKDYYVVSTHIDVLNQESKASNEVEANAGFGHGEDIDLDFASINDIELEDDIDDTGYKSITIDEQSLERNDYNIIKITIDQDAELPTEITCSFIHNQIDTLADHYVGDTVKNKGDELNPKNIPFNELTVQLYVGGAWDVRFGHRELHQNKSIITFRTEGNVSFDEDQDAYFYFRRQSITSGN